MVGWPTSLSLKVRRNQAFAWLHLPHLLVILLLHNQMLDMHGFISTSRLKLAGKVSESCTLQARNQNPVPS